MSVVRSIEEEKCFKDGWDVCSFNQRLSHLLLDDWNSKELQLSFKFYINIVFHQ